MSKLRIGIKEATAFTKPQDGENRGQKWDVTILGYGQSKSSKVVYTKEAVERSYQVF